MHLNRLMGCTKVKMNPLKEKNHSHIETNGAEWFIIIDNQQTGPLRLIDLKNNPRFTPDTLVWKKGFKEWTKARFVPDMKILFKDDPKNSPPPEIEKDKNVNQNLGQDNLATLTLHQDPYQFILWLLLALIFIFYLLFYYS